MKKCLVIDLDRCSGCDSCIVACKLENNIALGEYWNHVVSVGPFGTHPNIEQYWLPVQCQQCENAACVSACPTGASYRDDNNVVLVDKSKCIGCQYCSYACPYGVRSFNEEEKVAEKCTLCNHLTADGEASPACVHNCPTGARIYGDLDDPSTPAAQAVANADPASLYRLPDPGNAAPVTYYILSPKTAEWKELV